MRHLTCVIILLLVSGCSSFTITPQAAPTTTNQAQEITRAQSLTLRKIGSISATVRGSPDDAERAIAAKANAMGAPYYLILMVDDSLFSGLWRAQANLYAPLSTGRSQQ